jgi:hypothetical protein
MNDNFLILEGYKGGMRQLKDKSWSINLVTQELTPTELAHYSMLPDFLNVAFKADPFTKDEEDALDALEADPFNGFEDKSPSQKLRSVFFVLWKKDGEEEGTGKPFEKYYRAEMGKIITHFKNKIE